MHRAPAGALPRLRQNRARYEAAVRLVRQRAEVGDLEGVLRSATVAANFAWRAPIGTLNDPGLERLVVRAAGRGERPRIERDRAAGRVLHVLSEAYAAGGHSRLVWRWITRDPRRSDVALTNQHSPVPEALGSAVAASGGQLHDLRGTVPTLTGRAEALRALMDQADVVVHHVHPYDAVALTASVLPGVRPPVVYENHADFTFWLGLGCADVVSDFLDRGTAWSRDLRGIRPERLGLLPLPVEEVAPTIPAAEIRRRMGLRPDDVVALSVSTVGKTAPLWGRGFADVLGAALDAHPRLKVIVVLGGPPPGESWRALAERFRGRLIVSGPVTDPYSLYAAADIYLQSYPVPAGTSVLEAAMTGVPVLSLHDLTPQHGQGRLFHADSPGLAGVRHAVTTEIDYLGDLRRLIRDPALRADRGAATREAVLATHTGPGWAAALEALYLQARSVGPADLDEYPEAIEDLDYAAMMLPLAASVESTPELLGAAGPLGALCDERLVCDLFVTSNSGEGGSLSVRVAPGWEHQPEWTRRLLALTTRYARLAVSLPFAGGDDRDGSLSVAHLTRLLALDGRTTSDCGDISLDAATPSFAGPSVSGELALTPESLDTVELLASSPLWEMAGALPA